ERNVCSTIRMEKVICNSASVTPSLPMSGFVNSVQQYCGLEMAIRHSRPSASWIQRVEPAMGASCATDGTSTAALLFMPASLLFFALVSRCTLQVGGHVRLRESPRSMARIGHQSRAPAALSVALSHHGCAQNAIAQSHTPRIIAFVVAIGAIVFG